MNPKLERRFTPGSKVEVRESDGGVVIVGYAAVFHREGNAGTEYEPFDGLVEWIMPGAFDRALREDDVRGLFNHDMNLLLGRNTAGTLKLSVDSVGLRYEITVPDTQLGRDVTESIKRGDLTGSSFSFIPGRVVWVEEEDRDIRQIEEVQLFDVGPVTFPAYDGTSTGLRSDDLEALRQEYRDWKQPTGGSCLTRRKAEVELLKLV